MDKLLEAIRNGNPEKQVTAAYLAWKRWERQAHRPGNIGVIILGVGIALTAMLCAYLVVTYLEPFPGFDIP